ncbi:MAG: beta-galactosidase small subunit family protein, partial [Promethearchaeota archaeon]
KKVYQYIQVYPTDLTHGKIIIHNKYQFINLDFFDILWELTANGIIIQDGKLENIKIEAGEQKQVNFPFKIDKSIQSTEYHIKITSVLSKDMPWAKKGYIVAWDQFKIPLDSHIEAKQKISEIPTIKISESTESIKIIGKDFETLIGKNSGAIESLIFKSIQLVTSPLIPNFWRAPTDNDLGYVDLVEFQGNSQVESSWKNAGKSRKVKKFLFEDLKPNVKRINVQFEVLNSEKDLETVYTIYGTGDIFIENKFTPNKNMFRFGMQMSIPGEFSTMTWYGRGSHESMLDRKTGAAIGIYSGLVENLIHPYIRPQENGNRSDVRWTALTNTNGLGLLISDIGGTRLSISAYPYTMEDLENATHNHELPRRENITLNIDYKQQGVGGDIPALAVLHSEFKLKKNIPYYYGFRLRPYSKDMGDFTNVAFKIPPKI